MGTSPPTTRHRETALSVRRRIESHGERLWRLADFRGLPSTAVAKVLSRLACQGEIERISKGVYYRARETAFGKSRPNPADIEELASARCPIFPAGIAAANLLGFSTQTGSRREVATTGFSLPRKLAGERTIIHTRRPGAWARLGASDAALLDFLRRRGETSELSAKETAVRLLRLMAEEGRFGRLSRVSKSEPPRVRAMLGAIGESLGRPESELAKLRSSLNGLSRFRFGLLSALPHAQCWQVKEPE